MNGLRDLVRYVRHVELERVRGLRPAYPPVAVEVNPRELVLARLRRRRGRIELEAHASEPVPEGALGLSMLRPNVKGAEAVVATLRRLYERTGTRPGRVSVVLPDNLAKLALVPLPERPASKRHLAALIRFRLRRAVPFRLDDAVLSYQLLPGAGRSVSVLAAVMLRSVLEQYERVFEAIGARPGLVDLCTPNLYNLCRPQLQAAVEGGADAALLNCAHHYFSLMILRGGELVFFRCKSLPAGNGDDAKLDGVLQRELNSSLSYYREKLGGQGLRAILLRSVGPPIEEVASLLHELGAGPVTVVDPTTKLALPEGVRLEREVGQRLAPAVACAAGRV